MTRGGGGCEMRTIQRWKAFQGRRVGSKKRKNYDVWKLDNARGSFW